MRITKRGTRVADRAWTGHCPQCDSEATAKQGELTNITADLRSGEHFSWEKCPVCGGGDPGMNNWGGMIFYPSEDA